MLSIWTSLKYCLVVKSEEFRYLFECFMFKPIKLETTAYESWSVKRRFRAYANGIDPGEATWMKTFSGQFSPCAQRSLAMASLGCLTKLNLWTHNQLMSCLVLWIIEMH